MYFLPLGNTTAMLRRFRKLILSSFCLLTALPAAQANVVVVLNSRDATVQLLDQKTGADNGTFAVGKEPHHLMSTPDNKSLIVASSVGNELIFLDPVTGKIQRRLSDVLDPYQIGFSPDQKWFVSASLRLDRVDLYKYVAGNLVLFKRVPLPRLPSHIAFNAASTMAFVTQQGSDQVSAIELATGTIKWTIPVGKLPAGIVMTPDDKYLMVGIMGSDYVEVIDWRTHQSVKRIKAGEGAHNFRLAGDRRHMFVSNRVQNSINIIDTQTLQNVGMIPVPGGPDCMELTNDGKTLWATLRWIKKVAVIDVASRKVLRMIPVGRSPHGVFFANAAPRS
jgi:YVTN family beta-propeller protein